jgi:hypothetical protein
MKKIYLTITRSLIVPLMLIGMVLFFNACEKDEAIIEEAINQVEERFVVKNGVVHFTSIESFQKTIQEIKDFGSYDLAEWEKSKGIEFSMRKFQDELVETDDNSTPSDWLIPDQKFATVVNKDGFFAIGDEMHYITKSKEYIYKTDEDVDILNIESGKNENITVFNIVDGLSSKNWSDKIYYFTHWEFNTPESHKHESFRVIAYGWSKSWAAYCSNGLGLKAEFREKKWNGSLYWRSARFDYVEVCGTARYYINGTLYGQYNCDSGTNTSNEDCYIGQYVGIIHTDWIYGSFSFRIYNGNPTHQFNESWF